MLILNLWLNFQNFGIKTFRRAKEGDFMDAPMISYGEISGYGRLSGPSLTFEFLVYQTSLKVNNLFFLT